MIAIEVTSLYACMKAFVHPAGSVPTDKLAGVPIPLRGRMAQITCHLPQTSSAYSECWTAPALGAAGGHPSRWQERWRSLALVAHQSQHSRRQVQAVLSAAARDWLGVGRLRQEMAQRRAAAQIWFCRSGRQLQPLAAKASASPCVVATGDLGVRCPWVQHSVTYEQACRLELQWLPPGSCSMSAAAEPTACCSQLAVHAL